MAHELTTCINMHGRAGGGLGGDCTERYPKHGGILLQAGRKGRFLFWQHGCFDMAWHFACFAYACMTFGRQAFLFSALASASACIH